MEFAALDRAIGAVIGSAVGDALGAGYEYATPPRMQDVRMLRGTLTGEPAGHWTDDTSMAIGILDVAAALGSLATTEAINAVGNRFLDWFHSGPRDVGQQTAKVLSRAQSGSALTHIAEEDLVLSPRSAGNGSLMRTGPVALCHLDDEHTLARVAREISSLTHANAYAGDACVLWSIAIARSINMGTLVSPREALYAIPIARRSEWHDIIDAAEANDPSSFTPNGFVVRAFQAAWSAIVATNDSPTPYESGVRRAIAVGDDTDTVAAIAGALLGAAHGVTSIPFMWRRELTGWPGYCEFDLVTKAVRATRQGRDDQDGWPSVASMSRAYQGFMPTGVRVSFAEDLDVIFGDFLALGTTQADAYISLCRIGPMDRRGSEHHVVWLLDNVGNADAARVLADVADGINHIRRDGKRVFVHCVRAESRTPTVAMAWLMRYHGYSADSAERVVREALPSANPCAPLLSAVHQLEVAREAL